MHHGVNITIAALAVMLVVVCGSAKADDRCQTPGGIATCLGQSQERVATRTIVAPNGKTLTFRLSNDGDIGAIRRTYGYLVVSDRACWPLDQEQRQFVAELGKMAGPESIKRMFIGGAWSLVAKLGIKQGVPYFCEWVHTQDYVSAAYKLW